MTDFQRTPPTGANGGASLSVGSSLPLTNLQGSTNIDLSLTTITTGSAPMNRSAPDEQPWNSSDSKPGFWSMALRGFQTASGFASLVVNTGIDIARFPAKFLAAASDGWLGKPREQGYALIGNVREIFSLEEKKASAETDESNIDLDNVKYDDSKSVNEAMLKLFFDIRKYLGGLWRKSN